jgi:hypothetical protein
VIKSREMRWAKYVARMRALRNAYKTFVGNTKVRDNLEDPDIM